MYKIKLTTEWKLVNELENTVQLFSALSVDTIAVSCGDSASDTAFFLYKNGDVISLPADQRVWAKAFNPNSYIIAVEDTVKESCFVLDGSFDCSGFLVREALVYC